MEPPGIGRGDSRFNLGYSMNLLSGGETSPEIYGNPGLGRPSTSLQQLSPRHTMVPSGCGGGGGVVGRGIKSDVCSYDDRVLSGMVDSCGGSNTASGGGGGGGGDIAEDTYGSLQPKKSPPSNGKKTKGRVKIKMEYIENKLRRYTTFSKRKTGIMKKAYELSTLTGTQVMLLVASETGHVYTFATRKLQPMITSEAGKALIQTCLNSPDPPGGSGSAPGGDQRMSATGFEETELTYNISDDDTTSKDDNMSGVDSSADGSDSESELPNDHHPDQKPSFSSLTSTPGSHTTPTTSTNSLPQHLTIKQSSSPPALSSLSSSSSTPCNTISTSNLILNNNNPSSIITTSSSAVLSSAPMLYQTPEGMVYTTSNGTAGVLLSVSGNPNGSNSSAGGHGPPHFIAIPLSMMAAAAANGNPGGGHHLTQISNQGGELDLSKRK